VSTPLIRKTILKLGRLLPLFVAILPTQAQGQSLVTDRAHWAYPLGVIVTQDGGKIQEPKKAPEEAPRTKDGQSPKEQRLSPKELHTVPQESPTEKFLRQAAKDGEQILRTCAEELRANKGEMVRTKPVMTLHLLLSIAAHGRVAAVEYQERSIPPFFLPCASKNQDFFKGVAFPPRVDQRTILARIRMEIRFLTDEEAQGKGFQYFAAEKKWEQSLKEHSYWFDCNKHSDCIVATEACERRALNAKYLQEYQEAIRLRVKKSCGKKEDSSPRSALCQRRHCVEKKGALKNIRGL
jgi:hypothetical protein